MKEAVYFCFSDLSVAKSVKRCYETFCPKQPNRVKISTKMELWFHFQIILTFDILATIVSKTDIHSSSNQEWSNWGKLIYSHNSSIKFTYHNIQSISLGFMFIRKPSRRPSIQGSIFRSGYTSGHQFLSIRVPYFL